MNKILLIDEYVDFVVECLEEGEENLNEHLLNEQASLDNTVKIIQEAIIRRKYLGIYYIDGEDSGFRLIEPYVLGRGFVIPSIGKVVHPNRYYLRAFVIKDTTKDEYTKDKFKDLKIFRWTLRKGQKQSFSVSERDPYWRLFRPDKITRIKTLKQTFDKKRDLYNSDDKMIADIIISIPEDLLENKSLLY